MIFKFLNKNKEKPDKNAEAINIACLLVHAAKIDENYTSNEKEIIKLMGYKVFVEKNETFFKYKPFKKVKKSLDLKIKKDNPFEALKQLDLK